MNGCPACDQLRADIARAEAEGDTKRADFLRRILAGHVCENAPVVQWQSGAVWTVRA